MTTQQKRGEGARTVLFIDPSRSYCGACNQNADPNEESHVMELMRGEGCGATFTHVSSHYSNYGTLYDDVKRMRPDLPFLDPWEANFPAPAPSQGKDPE